MAEYTGKEKSPRHGIVFYELPTVKGSMYGGSLTPQSRQEYGPILDCVLEMADAISNGNGVTPEQAIEQVCKDNGWRLTPKHKKSIAAMLK